MTRARAACYATRVHPLVKGAVVAAALSLAGLAVRRTPPAPAPAPAEPSAPGTVAPAALTQLPCPERHLPEGRACVPLPDLDDRAPEPGGAQLERRSRGALFEVIPRKPDRPADPEAFSYPLTDEPLFLRGFDDPASEQSPVALELSGVRGEPVAALSLDGQEGATEVAASGRAIGTTVVTRHTLPSPSGPRTVLLVHGHLEAIAPDLAVGAKLRAGDLLGFVGDSGRPGVVSLYLEARVVRAEIDPAGLSLERLLEPATSVPTDARNVLPVR